MKKLKEPIIFPKENNKNEVLEKELDSINNGDYILIKIEHFLKLQSYENQVSYNFIIIEKKTETEFKVYDNTDFREEHNINFQNKQSVVNYVIALLSKENMVDYAQYKSLKKHDLNLEFGDKVLVKRPKKTDVAGYVINYRDTKNFEKNPLEDGFFTTLHVIPEKKDGSISKKTPIIIYANYELIKM